MAKRKQPKLPAGTVCKWADGYRAKVDAAAAYLELERIRKGSGGSLEPEVVFEEAQDPNNPLHPQFCWNKDKAWYHHNVEIARGLIRSIQVTHDRAPDAGASRAYYVVTRQDPESGLTRRVYKDTEEILANPQDRAELLARARNEATSYRRRYKELIELRDILQAIDSTFGEEDSP